MGTALAVLAAFVFAPAARAQTAEHRWSGEIVTGFLAQGKLADSRFAADFSTFGGTVVERSGGALDVVTSPLIGVRVGYRVRRDLYGFASWYHSTGRYRLEYPALASDPGEFNLEGLILAGTDFQFAGTDTRAESAFTTARSDMYLASLRYEFPVLNRWMAPFFTVGTGMFRQRSIGDIITVQLEGEVPIIVQVQDAVGINGNTSSGLPEFSVNSRDLVASIGGGFRASLGPKWGVVVEAEDVVRFADMSSINREFIQPDVAEGRVWGLGLDGVNGTIHNFNVRVSVQYSLWPYGAPR
ncbi:MAG: hypothetical protein KC591_11370 [Gemmatimonadetes bacterium]|nr:hypothetical protein [Gemmatimonadota bacterium]